LSTHNFQKDDKGKITIDDDVIMQQIVWQFCLFCNAESSINIGDIA